MNKIVLKFLNFKIFVFYCSLVFRVLKYLQAWIHIKKVRKDFRDQQFIQNMLVTNADNDQTSYFTKYSRATGKCHIQKLLPQNCITVIYRITHWCTITGHVGYYTTYFDERTCLSDVCRPSKPSHYTSYELSESLKLT